MAYDPLGFFQAGQKIGASKYSGLTQGTNVVMDAFKNQAERRGKLDDAKALKKYESDLISPKEQSQIDLNDATTKYLKGGASSNGTGTLSDLAKQSGYGEEDYIQNPTVTRYKGKMSVENAPKLKDPLDPKSTTELGAFRRTRQNLGSNLGLMNKPGVQNRMSPFSYGATRMPGANMLLKGESMMGDKTANDFLTFKAETDKVFQQFRKETTGAQAALKELGWLEPDYPMPTDPPDVYTNKSHEAMKRLEEGENLLLDLYSQRGFRVGDLRKGMNPLQQAAGNPRADTAQDSSQPGQESGGFETKVSSKGYKYSISQ